MLLRRAMEHVRTQNWLAVFLDFIIVVVGVYIGIQVANWNEGRLNKAEERIYLDRLKNDLEQSITNLNADRNQLEEGRTEKPDNKCLIARRACEI